MHEGSDTWTRAYRCSICGATAPGNKVIAPEAASELVRFCGIACYETWRRSLPVADRLAAPGQDLSVGE